MMATVKNEKKTARGLRIKQVGSGIACPREMRETLRGLGLRKMHQIVERKDSPETRGMIAKISHLVRIVE